MGDEHDHEHHDEHHHGHDHAHGNFASGQEVTGETEDKEHVGDFAKGQEHDHHGHEHHDHHDHSHG